MELSQGGDLHYPYLTSDAFDNPWQDRFQTRYDFVVSELFIDHLKSTGDPRLPYMADGTAISNGTEYVGLEYGLENPGILETLFLELMVESYMMVLNKVAGLLHTLKFVLQWLKLIKEDGQLLVIL